MFNCDVSMIESTFHPCWLYELFLHCLHTMIWILITEGGARPMITFWTQQAFADWSYFMTFLLLGRDFWKHTVLAGSPMIPLGKTGTVPNYIYSWCWTCEFLFVVLGSCSFSFSIHETLHDASHYFLWFIVAIWPKYLPLMPLSFLLCFQDFI